MRRVDLGRARAIEDPLWESRALKSECPLYPQKRTSITKAAMSALCQKRNERASEKHWARPEADIAELEKACLCVLSGHLALESVPCGTCFPFCGLFGGFEMSWCA
jgi:hypothetical protein